MVFYYNKTQANLGKLVILYISETRLTEEEIQHINEYQYNLLTDYIIYEGETAFEGYPIVEMDTIRKANDREMVERGIVTLKDGQKLVGDNIQTVERPEEYSYAYDWNSEEWVLNTSKLPIGIKFNGVGFEEVLTPEEYLKYHWEYPNWIDDTTDVDRAKKSLSDYLQMNNYLEGEDMKEKGILNDYKEYIVALKSFIESSSSRRRKRSLDLPILPSPSEKLSLYFSQRK